MGYKGQGTADTTRHAPSALARDGVAARLAAMKLASFEVGGRASYGIVVGDGVVDVGARFGARYPTLRAALAGDALGEIARAADAKADLALSAVRLLPPIPAPDKIVCIGLNYRAHAAEAGLQVPAHPRPL